MVKLGEQWQNAVVAQEARHKIQPRANWQLGGRKSSKYSDKLIKIGWCFTKGAPSWSYPHNQC